MKKEIIQQLYSAFEQAALEVDGVECWSARELCTLLGYSQWRNFVGVIDKAKTACENVGHNVSDHFADVSKKVDFAVIRSKGDQALFRLNTATLKRKMGVPASRPLADFLPTISIKAKDFAAEMTSMNVQTKDLQSETMIAKEHIDNNAAVRKMLLERGIVPENLPAAEDVKKVERRLASEEKKAVENKKNSVWMH